MSCPGYRHQPCECPDGGLKEDLMGRLLYVPDDGETGEKTLICHRCFCMTDETVYVHMDKNLSGPDGTPGDHGEVWEEDD